MAEYSITKILSQGTPYILPPGLSEANIKTDRSINNLIYTATKSIDALDTDSLNIIAENYIFGNPAVGISRNLTKAVEFLEKSAEQGSMYAHEALAVINILGLESASNYTKALDHLIDALQLSSVHALSSIGYLYLHTALIDSDEWEIEDYYELAAETGDAEAVSNLAFLYLFKNSTGPAIKLLELAAETRYLPALYNLGIGFMTEIGDFNYESAIKSFRKVIVSGPLSRYSRIGYRMARKQEYFGAFWAYSIAEALGYTDAAQSLGYLVSQGLVPYQCTGVKLLRESWYYLSLGQLGASTKASLFLGKIAYSEKETYGRNYTEAYRLFKMAEEIGEILYYIGYMNEQGLGVEKNITAAKGIYSRIVEMARNKDIDEDEYYPAAIALGRIMAQEALDNAARHVENWLNILKL